MLEPLRGGHSRVGRYQGGQVDRAVAHRERGVDRAVNAATGNVQCGFDADECVGTDILTAPGFADGAVGDGDISSCIAVSLDVDGFAKVAIEVPNEVGLGRRSSGGRDQGARDSHEGCGNERCESGLAREWVHGVNDSRRK